MTATPTFPAHWKTSDPRLLADTPSSRIWTVRLEDGRMAVVKDLKPIKDIADVLGGAHFLSWRDGVGAIRLLAIEGHHMLIEHAGERMLVHDLDAQGDDHATEIAAQVLASLQTPSKQPFPSALPPLRHRFESLFLKARTDLDAGRAESPYVAAAELADRLLADPRDVRPLHGDLHHENIMHGPRGWLVIDPIGVIGDAAYDAANMFSNPLDRDDLCLAPVRIAHMAEVFAKVLGQSPRRLLDYAFAYGCLSASWHAEDGDAENERRELSVADAIRTVRDTGF